MIADVKIYVVFGGEVTDPQVDQFKDLQNVHVAGLFDDYEDALATWRGEAQRTVDSATTRYFIGEVNKIVKE